MKIPTYKEAVSKEAASFTYVDKKSRWELKVE